MYQLKGQQFGRLLVVDRAGSDKAKTQRGVADATVAKKR